MAINSAVMGDQRHSIHAKTVAEATALKTSHTYIVIVLPHRMRENFPKPTFMLCELHSDEQTVLCYESNILVIYNPILHMNIHGLRGV